jgi:hypothetical protein
MPPLRLAASTGLVNHDLIGSQFFRQQNRIALAGIEPGQICVRR